MATSCDIIMRSNTTPEELAILGRALWRWYSRSSGDAILCQYVDNQALADLLAGKLPACSRAPRLAGRPSVHFRVPAAAYRDRQATLDSLRQGIPMGRVEEILIDGESWKLAGDPPTPGEIVPPASP